MDNGLVKKVDRLNELYKKKEQGSQLTEQEMTEQSVLRDELINYFQFAIRSSLNSKNSA
ncbi:MAG: DUF896 domain-containing protein [Lachnospiraceae bacterium]|nr:DUF896 domain-containing protein [Lachnospiraceae bacterium]